MTSVPRVIKDTPGLGKSPLKRWKVDGPGGLPAESGKSFLFLPLH